MRVSLFIKNTVILVFTSLILRTVGIFFKVWLADAIGSEGMGLYQLIFSVYVFASTFASSGISTAVTRLVAENEHKGNRAIKGIMRSAVGITLFVAAISVFVLLVFSRPIAIYLIKDERACISLRILCFSLPFMGLSSVARGYFLARRKTLGPSVVQLLEQTVRIAIVVFLVGKFAHMGLEFVAAAVLLGDTVAEAVSFLVNWLVYIKDRKGLFKGEKQGPFLQKILRIALPLSGGSYMSSLLHTVENLLVPTRLSYYYSSKSRGLELFGAVRGMALPILFFPASFLTSLSTLLIPEMSSAAAKGDTLKVRSSVTKSIGVTLFLATLVATVFMFSSKEIGQVIYHDADVGGIIGVLSPIVPLMYLESVTTGMLKGLDCQVSMLKYNTFDSIFRILAVFFALPVFGMYGYLAIMVISNTITSSLSLYCLLRVSGVRLEPIKWIVLPLVVGGAGGMLGKFMSSTVESTVLKLMLTVAVQAMVIALFFIKLHKAEKSRRV